MLRRIRTILILAAVTLPVVVAGAAPDDPAALHDAQPTPGLTERHPGRGVESLPLGPDLNQEATASARTGAGDGARLVSNIGMSQTLGALAGVVGLVLILFMGVRWISAKKGGLAAALGPAGRAPSGIIEVLARYPLSRTQRLVLLRVGPRVLLCCQNSGARASSASMTTLTEVTDPAEVAGLLRAVRDYDGTGVKAEFSRALKDLESAPSTSVQRDQMNMRTSDGDTVEWQDQRVTIPETRTAGPVDPAIGRLRARLAAMRMEERNS